jgi:hypothetical protein
MRPQAHSKAASSLPHQPQKSSCAMNIAIVSCRSDLLWFVLVVVARTESLNNQAAKTELRALARYLPLEYEYDSRLLLSVTSKHHDDVMMTL